MDFKTAYCFSEPRRRDRPSVEASARESADNQHGTKSIRKIKVTLVSY